MEISRKDAINKLWKKGVIHWKLTESQQDLYNITISAEKRILVFLCSRRLGKSFTLATIATEICLKKPNAVVKYLCPTQKMVKTILIPIIRSIIADCPKSLKPDHLVNEGILRFKNGSEIQFAGNDGGRAENLRGGAADLCIVDEAGFCDDLSYTVKSILLPTVATTGGKIILSSTPPKSPGHEFNEFIREAKFNGTLVKKTIYDNNMFTMAQIEEITQSYGGANNVEFRREYLCEMLIDAESAVFPEFTDELEKEVVKVVDRPACFDYYVAADLGFKDFTFVVFGYYHFRQDVVVIEDELVMSKITTQEFANSLRQKEDALLIDKNTNEKIQPYLRVSDVDWQIIHDMQRLHGIHFLPTKKDNKEAAINNARLLLSNKKVAIHPKCTNLIRHLKNATWKKDRRGFERSPDDGHYDGADAFIYLIRNIQFSKNPYPNNFDYQGRDVFVRPDVKTNDLDENLKNIFKIKRRF